ncbi:hypothetical protein ABT158_00125 [Nonomuraea sp. NPDC001636]|uniref:hypothetical protein n=1 Tax=Nonomuraea sp. NPDC001636 TaxID=3154391 RepID=UPI003332FEF7
MSETDELTFGDDREPWLRPWIRAHQRTAATVMVAVLLVAALGGGGWYLHRRSLLPSPPPVGALPVVDGFTVTLCTEGTQGCPEGTAERVLALVRRIPEAVAPTLVPADEVERRWAQRVIIDEGLAKPREASWIPQIEAGLRGPADYDAVRRGLAGEPGILLMPRLPSFWQGKADLSVVMCARRQQYPACQAAATEAQRDAVVARLRELEGVAEVFLQDKPFGLRLSRLYQSDVPLTIDAVSEMLYVRFDDPARARAVGQEMLRMPGVGWSQLIK